MKVLIAEDDITSQTMLCELVADWGFEPVPANNGEDAWDLLTAPDAPRLVLLDWEMPKLLGVQLCERIRQVYTTDPVYIIFITVRTRTEDIVQGLNAGANDFVTKPFAFSELKARVMVGARVLKLQSELNQARDMLSTERELIENIIGEMRDPSLFETAHVRSLQEPVEKTSGDILFSASRPDGGQHILLGDFTGHGLTAAIAGPLVSDIFYSMTAKGLPLLEIAQETNRQLRRKLPIDMFLAAIFIELSPSRQELRVWNCGMEPVLVFRWGDVVQRLESSFVALGILADTVEPVESVPVRSCDRVIAYSDGVTEAQNASGEEFGNQRLEQVLTDIIRKNQDIDQLKSIIDEFSCEQQQDDITLIELVC
ncbi:PP2C family protein-serine/threonine phosphatase [Neptunomonas marina]|uniref:Response regulator n=1 Tax=Neptunomonas marina TaxID=1815562 RepID=A0A437QCW9_9GAMM|nr:SpoIIE family protein phosphatase [Neptunomonas marina]RVU32390.1 response regulator [Neptunomonas marina]